MCILNKKYEDEGKIGGPHHIIQIDESKVVRRKFNRGYAREGHWILGLIETNGPLRLEICPKNLRNQETLFPLIDTSRLDLKSTLVVGQRMKGWIRSRT